MARPDRAYAALVVVARDHLEELTDRYHAGSMGTSSFAIYGGSAVNGETRGAPATGMMCFDEHDNNMSVSVLDMSGAPQEVFGDSVPVVVTARGETVERYYPDIVAAVGLDRSQLREPGLPRTAYVRAEMAHPIATTSPLLGGSLEDLVDVTAPTPTAEDAEAGWRTLWAVSPVKVPMVVVTGDDEGAAKQAAKRARALLPPFVREFTIVQAAVGVTRIPTGADESNKVITFGVPSRTIAVVGALDLKQDDVGIITKTSANKPDGRKIVSAVTRAEIFLPTISTVLHAFALAEGLGADTSDDDGELGTTLDQPVDTRDERIAALEQALKDMTAWRERAERSLAKARKEALSAQRDLANHLADEAPEVDSSADDTQSAVEMDVSEKPWDKALARYNALVAVEVTDEVHEVVAMARLQLRHVSLPGYLDQAAFELDAVGSKERVWCERTWRLLAAMEAFAIAAPDPRRADFRSYCASLANPPINPKQIAMKESRTVTSNPKMRQVRTFVVPEDVHLSGKVFMHAHARVSADGSPPAPRMYFYDDTRGATGKVHVGYVGKHLSNASTS